MVSGQFVGLVSGFHPTVAEPPAAATKDFVNQLDKTVTSVSPLDVHRVRRVHPAHMFQILMNSAHASTRLALVRHRAESYHAPVTSNFARDMLMAGKRSNVNRFRPGQTVHGRAGQSGRQGPTPVFASEAHQPGLDLRAEEPASADSIPDPTAEMGAWNAGREIRQGDAFQLIERLEDASVDLIITSPPYWGHRTYGLDHNWDILREWEEKATRREPPSWEWYRSHGGVLGLEPLPEWYVGNLVSFFSRSMRKLKNHGSLWVNVGDTYFARWASIRDEGRQGLGNNRRARRRTPMGGYLQEKQLLLIPARFAIAMENERWILRNDVIWFKPNVPPRPERDRLRLAHEHFFHFVKKPREGRANYYYDLSMVEKTGLDVVQCGVRPGKNGHSATFPIDLIRPRILSSSPPNGLVLDPFCGTGSAVDCAAATGRRAVGFELVGKFIAEG